jgi:hypothetical protein
MALGFPKMFERALAKTSIRSKPASGILQKNHQPAKQKILGLFFLSVTNSSSTN